MGSDALETSAGPRSPAPCAGEPCYGLQPGARPALARFAEAVTRIVETQPAPDVARHVRSALDPLLATRDLLDPAHRLGSSTSYRRHVLYADPQHRFTILALVWQPGQTTSVHGHSAWGAVGVYEGEPNVCCYDCAPGADDALVPTPTSDERFGPGATCAVQPGFDDAHRIYNGTQRPVITIHAYGRDLLREPESINLVLAS